MRSLLPLAFASAGVLALAAATPSQAGCSSGCSTCCLPGAHTVQVPGVNVVPPRVYVPSPTVEFGGVGSIGTSVDVSASASASSYADGSAAAGALGQTSALANSATVANLLASGGGASFYVDQGPSSTIGVLNVETPAAPAPVCLQYAAAVQQVAIQAVCLDDKDVPHPASQVLPGREVGDGYAGEVFRCIAGSRMQYVMGAFAGGQGRFEHGQTRVCHKGDALWRDASGQVQCRPQTPARDCNERSLLRRYGAGIKVMHASVAAQCVRWGEGATTAAAIGPGPATGMLIDGGVGGVAR